MNALLVSALWGVIMMFSGIAIKRAATIRTIALIGIAILLGLNLAELQGWQLVSIDTTGMLQFETYSLLFNTIILAAVLCYVMISGSAMEKIGNNLSDYLALLFFIICGMLMVSAFESLLMLFLGIEIITIPLYILTGSDKKNLKSNEASLKYFLLGAFSSGILLMGIALVYGARGSFALTSVADSIRLSSSLLLSGMLLLMIAMAFKVSAAPFHFWTPDVYDGAPTVFTSFMATVVKVAVFAAFVRLFDRSFALQLSTWQWWVAVLAALTMLIGNVTAVFQQSVKRMLSYSSIAQAGFMLLAVYAMNTAAKEGLLLYAAAYSLATIGIFAVLTRMKDYSFEAFNGMAGRYPWVAAALAIFFLSLAGIPLTGGFLAKFYMIKAALGMSLWLALFALIMAAVSVYYYFRVIQAMYFKPVTQPEPLVFDNLFTAQLLVMALAVVVLGLFPEWLIGLLYF
ncbi:MAG: NADH-quinone oxidoreductase subunit N [Chitinophagales bacterium]|jgi:NADH-quinone oxidoreductase subunit N|nr:NADH-quinone oxidoreductase subunit N [Chitinophagales bacterium]